MAQVVSSLALFVLAGLCEIGGGYLIWQWWRHGAHWGVGAVGALVLFLYGIVPTYQPSHFGSGLCCLWRNFRCTCPLFGDGVWTASHQIGMIYWVVASAWLGSW